MNKITLIESKNLGCFGVALKRDNLGPGMNCEWIERGSQGPGVGGGGMVSGTTGLERRRVRGWRNGLDRTARGLPTFISPGNNGIPIMKWISLGN